MAAKMNPEDMAGKLRELSREQSLEALQAYKKSELLEIARVAGISAAGNKDRIAGQIANHFGFARLNQRMSQRPPMER